MTLKTITTSLLAAAAIGTAIVAAPIASAADVPTTQHCSSSGTATQCASPGNAQITATTPHVEFHPYGGHRYLLGKH